MTTTDCGCEWERQADFGDVITKPCVEHRPRQLADIECGCRVSLDEGGETPPVVIRQCALHEAESTAREEALRQRLDYELDVLVHAAAKGKRVELIQGPDPTRGR